MNKNEFSKYQELGMGMIEGVGKSNFFIINNSYTVGGNVIQALNNPKFIAFNENMEMVSPEFDDLDELKAYLLDAYSSDVHKLRVRTGMNIKEFAEFFNIPYRSLQNWDLGVRDCPTYLIELMEYKLKNKGII